MSFPSSHARPWPLCAALTLSLAAPAGVLVACGDGGGGSSGPADVGPSGGGGGQAGGAGGQTGGAGGAGGQTGGTTPDAQGPGGAPTPDAQAPGGALPPDAGPPTAEQATVLAVPETKSIALPGLSGAVHVLRTEADVPHIYARDALDLARVQGYVTARDRFFMMDLARRLALGRISALLGDAGLSTDVTSRAQGMTEVAARMAANLTPTQRTHWQAYAEGINAYVAAVRAGTEAPPSELRLAAPLIGFRSAAEAMEDFTVADLAAFATTVLYQSGFMSDDLERELALRAAETAIESLPDAEARRAALFADLYENVRPVVEVASIERWPGASPPRPEGVAGTGGAGARVARPKLPAAAGAALARRLQRTDDLFGHVHGQPFGSNTWAVGGAGTPDGSALLAGDGHLTLSVPNFFFQTGLDTRVFGGGDVAVTGLVVPGLPPLGVGTNGRVAWSFTYFYADVTDWYAEQIRLGADGLPEAALFDGAWQPLARTDESYEVRNVPALQSVGRQETQPRFTLADGRRLMAVEGRPLLDGEAPGPGEAVINLGDGPWVPGDVDDDGIVSGISADYTGLDTAVALDAYESLAKANDVEHFRGLHRRLAVFGSHFNVADTGGRVLDTGYHAVPCRAALARTPEGRWAPGADPTRLLDGTKYGGFEIPFAADGTVDEAAGAADARRCAVPFDDFPAAFDPPGGFVFNANNDPGGYSFDGSLANDREYIGTSWDQGFRGRTIRDRLAALSAAREATPEAMSALQGDHRSALAERYLPDFLALLDRAGTDAAVGAPFAAHLADFSEVSTRLAAWRDAGYPARSGVSTFYDAPTPEAQRDAVATMIFNAWLGRVMRRMFDDEGLPDVDRVGDRDAVLVAFDRCWRGRGPDNPLGLVSWRADRGTGECLYFDDTQTPEIETSDALVLDALVRTLAFLRSPPTGPGEGGFGTDDMDAWLWGLRHQVRLESLLIGFLGDQPGLASLFSSFSITPEKLPLAPDLPADDPRADLPGFPRDGDAHAVDAAHPGLRAERFEYRHGPVFRMVVKLTPERTTGTVVLPGGQSGLNSSPHFADQAALWLGNQTLPLRFHTDDVVAGATGRETFVPARP
jgi:penicillin amidase